MGKARAMADWKLLFRAWNAWKSFIRTKRIDFETKQHKVDVIQMQRFIIKTKFIADECRIE